MIREEGTILLVVLVALAVLAALAGLVIRVSESDLSTLSAERAAMRRQMMTDSALAILGARLPAADLAEGGTLVTLAVPDGIVTARIDAAAGLINPNFTRVPVLAAALSVLGATPEQAERLSLGMAKARGAANRMAFGNWGRWKSCLRASLTCGPRSHPI